MLRALLSNPKNLALVLGPLLGCLAYVSLAFSGQSPEICCTVAVTVWVAVWWVFEPVPIPVTSLIPFALLPLGGVLSHSQVSQAYGHTLIMLLMAGFILSTAMEKSGAHRRVALTMVRLIGGGSGRRLVLGFMVASAVLSMWISNTATTLMLLPVAMAVLEQSKDKKQLAIPLLLGIAFAANIGGIGTPVGTPPNVLFMAHYQEYTGKTWSFLGWMKIGVPIVIVMVPATWFWLTCRLRLRESVIIPHPGKWRPEEVRVLTIFAITSLLWVTRGEPLGGWGGLLDQLWLHQGKSLIGDSTVALAMCVVMFVVSNGKGGRLLDWETAVKVPWGLLLLFAGGMALGMAFKESGLSMQIGTLLSGVTTWNVLAMIVVICLVMTFLTEVTSNTATTNLMMPILAGAAMATDARQVAPELLMVPAAISASCAFMLPVATAPNAIVFGTEYISTRDMVRNGFMLNLIGAAVITIACYFLLR